MNYRIKDLTGQRFGRLLALKLSDKRDNQRGCIWKCQCDCGNIVFVRSRSLCNNESKSCGCVRNEKFIATLQTHGLSHLPIYKVWTSMLQRCENPNSQQFKDYGGRGISVCKRWHKFENFYEDMGECPSGLTLERRNNDGNYRPENCYYATRKEQSANTRAKPSQRWFRAWHRDSMAQYLSNNQTKFAKKHNLGQSSISAYLLSKLKTYKGWEFKYLFEHQNISKVNSQ